MHHTKLHCSTPILHYTALKCTALYCISTCYIALHCSEGILHYTGHRCTTMDSTALHQTKQQSGFLILRTIGQRVHKTSLCRDIWQHFSLSQSEYSYSYHFKAGKIYEVDILPRRSLQYIPLPGYCWRSLPDNHWYYQQYCWILKNSTGNIIASAIYFCLTFAVV